MAVLQRVADDDPNRCQAVHASLQCPFKATGTRFQTITNGEPAWAWNGPMYCPRHGGTTQKTQESTQNIRMYLAARWQEKIGQQAYHPKYKSLREEMGILRMTLERRLDACSDDQSLLLYSGQITELVREIGKLAKVAHVIEKDMGHLLDKTQAEAWVQELLGIIGNYLPDPEILQFLSQDIIASLANQVKPIG